MFKDCIRLKLLISEYDLLKPNYFWSFHDVVYIEFIIGWEDNGYCIHLSVIR